ncbi:LVIVD repeat-containing protein [Pararhodonellum marinum]|uniref:LVIVD repeat-containing protein n=1 Tax=Pararhodonellum marinum TaxID=2755358 RepID=UPI00188F4168|nr:hypothetical protein [Pararhodonellum marinum]
MGRSLYLRHNWSLNFLLSLFMVLLLPACQDEVETTYTYHTQVPVFLQINTFREAEIIIEPGKQLENPGKIYIYGDYLFVNEPKKGIHIINNQNPSNPVNINFINVPGTVDMAINSNILYADSYVDLVAFDISNPQDIKVVKRVEDVFPNIYTHQETGTFVTYKDTVITTTNRMMPNRGWGNGLFFSDAAGFSSQRSESGGQSYGQGGSMARFTLMSGHLYAVNDYELRVFDVQSPTEPAYLDKINLGWGIETIFPFQDKLFIGSMTGMHIYDASQPSSPKKMAVYEHVTACDPVVVNENYAFVTLRSGMMCRMDVDQLQVIDIKNPYQPKLLKAYPMDNPHGLGLAGDYLYLAEGLHGLKSFNVSDVLRVSENQLEHLKEMKSVDIIPGPKALIVIGPDGVCQFDYSNPEKLRKLSCIDVRNPMPL